MEWFELMKDLKEKSGMTNHLIAKKSGVPEPTLEKIFSGATRKPGINTVIDIIHAMGGTLDSIDPAAQTRETKKSPSTTEVAPGDTHISLEESNNLLVALGLIKEGQQLSDEDLAFLTHVIGLLEAWFGKHH